MHVFIQSKKNINYFLNARDCIVKDIDGVQRVPFSEERL